MDTREVDYLSMPVHTLQPDTAMALVLMETWAHPALWIGQLEYYGSLDLLNYCFN